MLLALHGHAHEISAGSCAHAGTASQWATVVVVHRGEMGRFPFPALSG